MPEIIAVSVVMVFFAVGIFSTAREIFSIINGKYERQEIIVRVTGDAESAENAVRKVLSSNRNAEIFLLDESGNSEVHDILEKLCGDFDRLHMDI